LFSFSFVLGGVFLLSLLFSDIFTGLSESMHDPSGSSFSQSSPLPPTSQLAHKHPNVEIRAFATAVATPISFPALYLSETMERSCFRLMYTPNNTFDSVLLELGKVVLTMPNPITTPHQDDSEDENHVQLPHPHQATIRTCVAALCITHAVLMARGTFGDFIGAHLKVGRGHGP
jgi:hypothetical protein